MGCCTLTAQCDRDGVGNGQYRWDGCGWDGWRVGYWHVMGDMDWGGITDVNGGEGGRCGQGQALRI